MENKKTIIVLTLLILGSLGLVSAMYSGETETFDMGFEIVNCSIINNTYNLDGLNLTWNNTNVTVETVINYKPDNFSISCWIIKYGEQADVSVSSSGGSGRVIYPKEVEPIKNVTDYSFEDIIDTPKIIDTPEIEEPKINLVLIFLVIIGLIIVVIYFIGRR